MNTNPDIWDLKFKKEGWTFAFGSLMQAYAQSVTPETPLNMIKNDALELYELAKQMCATSVEENLIEKQKVAGNPDDIDIPV